VVKRFLAAASAAAFLFAAGCGYTTKSNLPDTVKNIHVAPVKNAIDLSAEVSTDERFRTYRPGVEVDVTNAIINRFIFDGHLNVTGPETADAIVEAKLVDYRRDALRYSEDDDIQEYRLNVVVSCKVTLKGTGKPLWEQNNLTGDTTFFLSGSRAVSEDEAVTRAVEDLARRVVENTVEIW